MNEEEHTAFISLIKAVSEPRVLALPKLGLPDSFHTDANAYHIGCAHYQSHSDDERKPIGYWSISLTKAEKNYSVSEKENLVVVWPLLTLRL